MQCVANSSELWQLYNEQGVPLVGRGATKQEVLTDGLLHGASHIWIWRSGNGSREVLVQKRAAHKRTWPNMYDISVAGHIDLGESPLTAAVREAREEIGIEINAHRLKFISVQRMHIAAAASVIENEFQWVYLYEVRDDSGFVLQKTEVTSLEWKTLADFKQDISGGLSKIRYVPHGENYFRTLIAAFASTLAEHA